MLLATYKEWLDGLFITIANEFNVGNDNRKSVFGTFKIQGYTCRCIKGLYSVYTDMERFISWDTTTHICDALRGMVPFV